ncbi:MAG: S9 family peptidase, partial [Bacteroidia bacterium]|nr:S9 family peptidase [Bacteroidia bacterium]
MKKIHFILIALMLNSLSWAQTKKTVSLEDVWLNYTFYPESVYGVNWMKDGRYYSSQNDRFIIKYDIVSGKAVDTLYGKAGAPENYIEFSSYALSPQEDKILLAVEEERIYRRSSKAYFYIYDIAKRNIKRLVEGEKQSYASFSPDGNKIAFVRNNNIFVTDITTQETRQITETGEVNKVIHGSADWVYEEEFSFAQAFFWSPDSKKIAYQSFYEQPVDQFFLQYWLGAETSYPYNYEYKYPKAGEENSTVTVSIYNLEQAKTTALDLGRERDIYIPRINWTEDPNILSVRRMNRLQNQLDILHANLQNNQ